MKDAVSNSLDQDVSSLRGFSKRQEDAIAQQTKMIAEGIACSEITKETGDFLSTTWKIWR